MYRTKDELHAQIRRFISTLDAPDGPPALSFSGRLAEDNGWSAHYAQRVIEEYGRFAVLAVAAGHPVSPSDAVDQAWHLHLLDSRSYWDHFCPEVLGVPLHHEPARGAPGERSRLAAAYASTLASYERRFGEAPPADIWPSPGERLRDDARHRRVNVAHRWLLPRPRLSWLPIGVAALELGMALSGEPFTLAGPDFLLFYGASLAVAGGLAWWVRRSAGGPSSIEIGGSAPELDPYEAAYLQGGVQRAYQVAFASLGERGLLSSNLDGRPVPAGEAPPELHPIERAVHFMASAPPLEGASLGAVAAQADPLMVRLTEEGLLVEATESRRAARLSSLPLFGLLGVGVIKIGIGLSLGRPVTLLVMACFVTVLLVMAIQVPLHRTRLGDRVLARLTEAHAGAKVDGSCASGPALRWGVALFGVEILAGGPLDFLAKAFAPRTDGAGGGVVGGGGGGGCGGGGGGGGGGCGGCSG